MVTTRKRHQTSTDQSLSLSLFETFRLAWKDEDLRARLIFVIGVFAVFTLGVYIPVPIPGYSTKDIAHAMNNTNGILFQLMSTFGGGAIRRLSVFSLGLQPYITAQIIFQILQSAIPAWKEEQKEGGEYARQAMNRRIRLATIILCVAQGFGFVGLFAQGLGPIAMSSKIIIVTLWTCGAMFCLWLGEQISERGIGNGVSLMIFAGIIIALPQTLGGIINGLSNGVIAIWSVVLFVALFLVTTWVVVYFSVAQRQIPVQHMKRMQGTRSLGGQVNYLPLSVVMVGVIPIIFAIALIFMPVQIAQVFPLHSKIQEFLIGVESYLNPGNPNASLGLTLISSLIFVLIIGFFTYFYTAVQFDVDDMSDNLKRQGSFIPGMRPGKQTADFLNGVVSRLTLVGAVFLAAVSLVQFLAPRICQLTSEPGASYIIGGTTLLILVQVALDFMRQIEANLLMKQYGN